MSTIKILGQTVRTDYPDLQTLLQQSYTKKARPECLCVTPPAPMCIAKVRGKYVLKRLPNSGAGHSPICDSYDPPAETSGLGEVLGTAIKENPDDGTTSLQFDFSLTKTAGKAAPVPGDVEHESVKSNTSKLSLRSALHYLWKESELNKWVPKMAGKRSYYVVRKCLLEAAENKLTKGSELGSLLYVPEKFNLDDKEGIKLRRKALLSRIAGGKGVRKLMIAVGEVKEFAESRYGKKMVLYHAADFGFNMKDELYTRVEKVFGNELAMTIHNEDEQRENHLIAICTFGVDDAGFAHVEELTFMPVDVNWIPFENILEKTLLEALYAQEKRFVKGLRFNMKKTKPLASAVLSETTGGPTALYIVKPGASEEYTDALNKIVKDSELQSWVWNVDDGVMPEIPS